MKNKRWVPVFLLVLFPCYAFSQQVVDRIVAVVGDEIILESELNQYTLSYAQQLGIDPQKDAEKLEELKKSTLDNMIIQKILLAKAQEDSIKVEDTQVDQALQERIDWLKQQLGSEEKVEEYLGAPIKKIKRELRDEVRKGLLVQNLQREKFAKITVSRREVEEFYHTMRDSLPELQESVKIRHILMKVKPSEAAKKQALDKIAGILKRIKAGEDFGEMARKYSEDPGSAPEGGKLGFIQRGDFIKEFEEAAFSLKPGELSGIVETQFGYHIIQLLERRGEKINVRHILIRVQPTEEDEKATLDRLKDIRDQIVAGADFAKMAEKYSDDQATADKGGELGWYEVEKLQLDEFKKVVKDLEVGEISEPFKTRFGFHIIQLEKRREPGRPTLEKDWEQIEMWALNEKRNRWYQRWVEQLKTQLYIDIRE